MDRYKRKKVVNLDESIIKSILEIGSRYDIEKIVLFGSRARGDNKKTSDIDLAVYCDEDLNDESRIYFELEDMNTLLKIDVVFINSGTDKRLIENIEKEGVIVYERKQ